MLTLINARVFDGQKMLPGRHSVTLDAGRIVGIGEEAEESAGGIIDLDGMTLMPGLVTCHLHPDFHKFSFAQAADGQKLGKELPPGVLMAIGVRTCRILLESGFTGYVGAACSNDIDAQLKMAIAQDIIPGPRIRACSHHVATTGDANDTWKWWQRYETPGVDLFADGPDELRKVVRNEIRRGAQTIKIFASLGHGLPGPAMRNMSRDEIEAVVNAAHERGARVRAHVADKQLILECLELGVDIIDHGDGVDEECIEKMVKAGTFWVPSQIFAKALIDLGMWDVTDDLASFNSVRRMLPLAHQAGVRILLGDDYSGEFMRGMVEDNPLDHEVGCYGRELAYYGGIEGLSAADVLSWGTRNAGELLTDGRDSLGVIEPGALADLIIVDGDPIEDLTLFSRPEESLKAVIRDGAFAINRIAAG